MKTKTTSYLKDPKQSKQVSTKFPTSWCLEASLQIPVPASNAALSPKAWHIGYSKRPRLVMLNKTVPSSKDNDIASTIGIVETLISKYGYPGYQKPQVYTYLFASVRASVKPSETRFQTLLNDRSLSIHASVANFTGGSFVVKLYGTCSQCGKLGIAVISARAACFLVIIPEAFNRHHWEEDIIPWASHRASAQSTSPQTTVAFPYLPRFFGYLFMNHAHMIVPYSETSWTKQLLITKFNGTIRLS